MEAKEDCGAAEVKEKDDEKEMVVDVEMLRDGFTPGAEGEVPLQEYVNAFSEMSNFFKLLGPLFHFVAYDINMKVSQLKGFLAGETCEHYVDVRTMLDYETDKGLLEKHQSLSGAKIFLHLHRGLEFTREFMKELLKEEEEPSLGPVSSALYQTTVGRFHPSMLSTAFSGVLLLLPQRATIRSRIAKGNPKSEEKLKRIWPDMVEAVEKTYAASQTLYEERELLQIA